MGEEVDKACEHGMLAGLCSREIGRRRLGGQHASVAARIGQRASGSTSDCRASVSAPRRRARSSTSTASSYPISPSV